MRCDDRSGTHISLTPSETGGKDAQRQRQSTDAIALGASDRRASSVASIELAVLVQHVDAFLWRVFHVGGTIVIKLTIGGTPGFCHYYFL